MHAQSEGTGESRGYEQRNKKYGAQKCHEFHARRSLYKEPGEQIVGKAICAAILEALRNTPDMSTGVISPPRLRPRTNTKRG